MICWRGANSGFKYRKSKYENPGWFVFLYTVVIIKGLVRSKKGGDLKCLVSKQQCALFGFVNFIYSITKTKTDKNLQAIKRLCFHSRPSQPKPQLAPWESCGAGGWRRGCSFTEILISCTYNT